jgi:putative Holliday junction resolvase
VPVRLVDERMTTAAVTKGLRAAGRDARSSRAVVDQAAAVMIVQHALDAERATGAPPGTLAEPPEDLA